MALATPYHEVMPEPIYLDHNATTPLLPEVAEAMQACWLGSPLNPASQHEFGRRARRVLEDSRDRIAELLGAKTTGLDADRVIFTSGGTESNNLAIRGLLPVTLRDDRAAPGSPWRGEDGSKHHLVISAVEHPSITAVADQLQHDGFAVDRLPIGADGVIRVSALEPLLRQNTRVVAALLGQNETGILQPVAELAATCAAHDVPLHTDAAQVVGKLPVHFRSLGVSTMTVAAHKFHGPIGIGALVVRHGIDIQPQLQGGFQQAGVRPGTEPVALAVGMCRALELWHEEQEIRTAGIRSLRDRFEHAVLAGWPAAVIIGANAERLPHVSNIAFVGLNRQALFMALDQAGVACSPGSACASGAPEASPVLLAMGCNKEVLTSALRFSLGVTTRAAEVDEAARRILHCCKNLRRAE